jgi:hypothetical protein
VLKKIFPLQERTGVNLEKAPPSSGIDDTKKHVANEVLKEGEEVVIPDGIFSTYKKQTYVSTPKKMKFILKIKSNYVYTFKEKCCCVRYMFPMAPNVILLDGEWIAKR